MISKIINAFMLLILFFIILYMALVIFAMPIDDHPYFAGGPPQPWVIAHQGGDGLWPGNTLFAYERSVDMGVDILEMDIHSTADDVLVLIHDETVDRTTNGIGRVNNHTLGELRTLDAAYNWSSDEGETFPFRNQAITIPTLEEVFVSFPTKRMNIEIKQTEPSITNPLCRMIRKYQMTNKVLIASFNKETIDNFRQECPEVATSAAEGEVISLFALSRFFLEGVVSPDANALQVPEYRGFFRVLGQRLVNAAHKRNLEVHVWTINETEDMERVIELGVNAIITDRPDKLLELLGRG